MNFDKISNSYCCKRPTFIYATMKIVEMGCFNFCFNFAKRMLKDNIQGCYNSNLNKTNRDMYVIKIIMYNIFYLDSWDMVHKYHIFLTQRGP